MSALTRRQTLTPVASNAANFEPTQRVNPEAVISLLLKGVADGVIKIGQEFGLSLFCVRESFTPGVVNLVVPAIIQAPSDLGLQAVVV